MIKVHEKNDLEPDLEGVWLDKRGRVGQLAWEGKVSLIVEG